MMQPDLIFLDINMPVMDCTVRRPAVEFLEAFRTRFPEKLPVVLLTASNHPSDLQQAARYRVRYYLINP